MAEQMRPASPKQAPDPSNQFDRSDPKRESGQGKVDINQKATPTDSADAMESTVAHAQAGDKQLNSEEAATADPHAEEIKNEPLGWEKDKK